MAGPPHVRGLDRVEAGNAGGGNSPKAEQKRDMFTEYIQVSSGQDSKGETT